MLALAVGALLGLSAGPARAFHDGGVAHCDGCHTMHASQDGSPVGSPILDGEVLLLAENATEVCLLCHADSYGAVLGRRPLLPPAERGPGNFVFLMEDDINDAVGTGPDAQPIGGHRAGHSIVAPSHGLDPDPELTVAPGGIYPSSDLGCTSCHDPHGNAGFRLLRDVGSITREGFVFTRPAPLAEGLDPGSTEVESSTSHTAYRGGWSAWCGNCHGDYHESTGDFAHPVDRALGDEHFSYNEYDGPDAPEGGSQATAYLPEVPIEDPSMTVDGTQGAIGASRVTCMSCHRAHATSAPAALRWDPKVLRLADDGFESGSWPIPDPYAHPEQRSLCVKCHWPEASDHGLAQPCMSCHGQDRFSDALDDPFRTGSRRPPTVGRWPE